VARVAPETHILKQLQASLIVKQQGWELSWPLGGVEHRKYLVFQASFNICTADVDYVDGVAGLLQTTTFPDTFVAGDQAVGGLDLDVHGHGHFDSEAK
jgi:hypothetical protein